MQSKKWSIIFAITGLLLGGCSSWEEGFSCCPKAATHSAGTTRAPKEEEGRYNTFCMKSSRNMSVVRKAGPARLNLEERERLCQCMTEFFTTLPRKERLVFLFTMRIGPSPKGYHERYLADYIYASSPEEREKISASYLADYESYLAVSPEERKKISAKFSKSLNMCLE